MQVFQLCFLPFCCCCSVRFKITKRKKYERLTLIINDQKCIEWEFIYLFTNFTIYNIQTLAYLFYLANTTIKPFIVRKINVYLRLYIL